MISAMNSMDSTIRSLGLNLLIFVLPGLFCQQKPANQKALKSVDAEVSGKSASHLLPLPGDLVCAEGGNRTHTPLRRADFRSPLSDCPSPLRI